MRLDELGDPIDVGGADVCTPKISLALRCACVADPLRRTRWPYTSRIGSSAVLSRSVPRGVPRGVVWTDDDDRALAPRAALTGRGSRADARVLILVSTERARSAATASSSSRDVTTSRAVRDDDRRSVCACRGVSRLFVGDVDGAVSGRGVVTAKCCTIGVVGFTGVGDLRALISCCCDAAARRFFKFSWISLYRRVR